MPELRLRYTEALDEPYVCSEMKIRLTHIASLLGISILSASVYATPSYDDSGIESFIKIAATIRAGAEVCNTYTMIELDELREQQRKTVAEMGMGPERFDDIFETRYQDTHAMLAKATQSEMDEICEDMESFPIDEWR